MGWQIIILGPQRVVYVSQPPVMIFYIQLLFIADTQGGAILLSSGKLHETNNACIQRCSPVAPAFQSIRLTQTVFIAALSFSLPRQVSDQLLLSLSLCCESLAFLFTSSRKSEESCTSITTVPTLTKLAQ